MWIPTATRWIAFACLITLTSADAFAGAFVDTVLALSPSHYWKLDETEGSSGATAVDSVGDIDGTYQGFLDGFEIDGMIGVPGPQAELALPGFDADNVAFNPNNASSVGLGPGAALAASTMTVSTWFKVGSGFPGGSNGGDRIWTNNQSNGDVSFQLTLGGGANLVVGLNPSINGFPTDGSLPSGDGVGNFQLTDETVSIKDEIWHHVVASRNGNNIEDVIIVVDGVHYPVETWSDSTDTWGTTTTDAQIATRTPPDGGGSLQALNGPIDEVAVWLDRQLTVEDSIALYRAAVAPGDYNGDNVVDAADYTVWRDGGWADSSQAAYDTWAANYGNDYTPVVAEAPEPGSLFVALSAAAVGVARRRVRRRC